VPGVRRAGPATAEPARFTSGQSAPAGARPIPLRNEFRQVPPTETAVVEPGFWQVCRPRPALFAAPPLKFAKISGRFQFTRPERGRGIPLRSIVTGRYLAGRAASGSDCAIPLDPPLRACCRHGPGCRRRVDAARSFVRAGLPPNEFGRRRPVSTETGPGSLDSGVSGLDAERTQAPPSRPGIGVGRTARCCGSKLRPRVVARSLRARPLAAPLRPPAGPPIDPRPLVPSLRSDRGRSTASGRVRPWNSPPPGGHALRFRRFPRSMVGCRGAAVQLFRFCPGLSLPVLGSPWAGPFSYRAFPASRRLASAATRQASLDRTFSCLAPGHASCCGVAACRPGRFGFAWASASSLLVSRLVRSPAARSASITRALEAHRGFVAHPRKSSRVLRRSPERGMVSLAQCFELWFGVRDESRLPGPGR